MGVGKGKDARGGGEEKWLVARVLKRKVKHIKYESVCNYFWQKDK